GAPDASALFPREAAANRGLFYANGQARSAQGLLERLQLDADASMNAARGAPQQKDEGETMSPALAQALFAMALLPLLRSGEEERTSPLQALSAYARANSL